MYSDWSKVLYIGRRFVMFSTILHLQLIREKELMDAN